MLRTRPTAVVGRLLAELDGSSPASAADFECIAAAVAVPGQSPASNPPWPRLEVVEGGPRAGGGQRTRHASGASHPPPTQPQRGAPGGRPPTSIRRSSGKQALSPAPRRTNASGASHPPPHPT